MNLLNDLPGSWTQTGCMETSFDIENTKYDTQCYML